MNDDHTPLRVEIIKALRAEAAITMVKYRRESERGPLAWDWTMAKQAGELMELADRLAMWLPTDHEESM